jgi:hypothetical protein
MTVEAAVYAGGVLLISFVIWQTHRVNIRRLSEIQREVNGLRDVVSRAFLTALNEQSAGSAAPAERAAQLQSDPVRKDAVSAPEPEIESDLVQINALCAKLITLAPPKEALSLISKPDSKNFWRDRPWPLRKP